jgi:hypothetical protein
LQHHCGCFPPNFVARTSTGTIPASTCGTTPSARWQGSFIHCRCSEVQRVSSSRTPFLCTDAAQLHKAISSHHGTLPPCLSIPLLTVIASPTAPACLGCGTGWVRIASRSGCFCCTGPMKAPACTALYRFSFAQNEPEAGLRQCRRACGAHDQEVWTRQAS